MRIIVRILVWFAVVLALILVGFSSWALFRERDVAKDVAPKVGEFISVGENEIYIQRMGNSNNPSIILIHGMAAWSETWRPTMVVLEKAGWYVIAADMPPFGFSERPWDRSYWREAQGQRIVALKDALGLKRPVIVAHSYGSRGALEAVMSKPDSFGGLVMVDPALDGIYGAPAASIPQVAKRMLNIESLRYGIIATSMTNPFLSKRLLQLFMHKKDAATDAIVALYQMPSTLQWSTTDLGYWVYGFLTGEDTGLSSVAENYANIAVPVVLLWGREDTTTPFAQGLALQALIPNSALVGLPDVGHMPHLEDPASFQKALLDALKRYQ